MNYVLGEKNIMALFNKKQQLGQGNPKEKPEKMPPPKKEKQDTSIFKGKPFIRREKLRGWLKTEEAWRETKKPLKERVGLEKKLFDPKKFGEFIDPREVEKVYKEIKDFPTKAKEKYKIQGEGERLRTLKALEKLMGK
jgi:hypothetical protein